MTTPERRAFPRTKLRELTYLDLGPDNGGIVLDVSDGGLAFRAVAPLEQARELEFSLLVMGKGRFSGAGEIVWTDNDRKTCGLRFTAVSSDIREQIENWTGRPHGLAAVLKSEASPIVTHVRLADSPVEATGEPVVGSAQVHELPSLSLVRESNPLSHWSPALLGRIALGALVAMLLVIVFNFGRRMGESENKLMAPSGTKPEPQPPTVPTGQLSAPPTTSLDQSAAAIERSSTVRKLQETSEVSALLEPSPALPVQHEPRASEAGQSELDAALAELHGTNGIRDSRSAVPLLWASVAKGNYEAEVVLADLYLRGDGVTKNCTQGRVLLASASKNGNAEAGRKLKELNSYGCQ